MRRAKAKLLSAMGIFGTIGIFIRYIPLPSATIAMYRGGIAVLFLTMLILLTGKRVPMRALVQKLPLLCLSGLALGGNWILLFESYHYTTVATASVCNYLAPVFLLLALPLVGEKLTIRKLLCVLTALTGLVFLSGVLRGGIADPKGILLATGAAVLYATVVLLNKITGQMEAYHRTVVQMATAAIMMLIYSQFAGQPLLPTLPPGKWALLLTVCIVHTGVAYALYFDSIRDLTAQTAAVFSYLDPVVSILLSALILRERMDWMGVLGAILILGSALCSELPERKKDGQPVSN